jgi:microfibrillar-associated protein 1
MTDEEIMREKREKEGETERGKMKYLQKYYHKGAFYTDDTKINEALATRNFAQPTLEDKFNKELLPSVMQVKDFGRSGRTKYTHLVDQDTSQVRILVQTHLLERCRLGTRQ